jgi:large exoprotein involved in heme utilization and adhesion
MDGGLIQASGSSGSAGNIGSLEVRVGRLTLTGGAELGSWAFGSGHGGDVTVVATEAIAMAGQDNYLFSNVSGSGDGGRLSIATPLLTMDGGLIHAAGSLEVQTGRLTLTRGAQLSTSASGSRRGGDLTVVASEAITMNGRGGQGILTGLFSATSGSGDGGRLFVSTPLLTIDSGWLLSGGFPDSSGNAGNLEVQAGRLTLTEGAQLSTSASGPGRGGALTVVATEAIAMAGQDSHGTRSGLSSDTSGRGAAGRLFISAPTVRLEDGGIMTASARGDGRGGDMALGVSTLTLQGGSQIESSTSGAGQGGTITVTAGDVVSLSGRNSGLFSNAAGGGTGGALELRARDFHLTDGARLSATSAGRGNAGRLRILATERFRSDQSVLTTEAIQADGGNIQLMAGSLVQLIDSQLTATSRSGVGQEGNILLNAPFVVLDRSQIRTQAFGGPGGNIRIGAEAFLASSESVVSASSTLEIAAAVTNPSEAIALPPPAFVRAEALLPARCAARFKGGSSSSLVLGGHDGLPLEPGSVLPSPLALEERLVADPAVMGNPHQQLSAARFAFLEDHERVLPRLPRDQWTGRCSHDGESQASSASSQVRVNPPQRGR